MRHEEHANAEQIKTWTNTRRKGARSTRQRQLSQTRNSECPEQAAALLDFYRLWADRRATLYMATSRIALAEVTAALQALQREVQAFKSPPCLQMAQLSLQTLVGKSVESILQFMGKEEITNMLYRYVERPKLIPQFEREVANARCE